MDMVAVRALIPVEDADMVPPPKLFQHPSTLHGQAHVGRVLVHGLRLIAATGLVEEVPRLWAAVYLHDLARTHDGHCTRHGGDAWARLATLPEVVALFTRGGVQADDLSAIQAAVTMHSEGEPSPDHPHRGLIRFLKDADGLDRVRLGDLDPDYLRHAEARGMIRLAQRLYGDTDHKLPTGSDYFARLWPEAQRLAAQLPDRRSVAR
jgi:hypothetical protein